MAINLPGGGGVFGHSFHGPRTRQAHAILVFSDWTLPSDDAAQALTAYRHRVFKQLNYLPLHAHEPGDVYAVASTATRATELLTGMVSRLDPAIALQEDETDTAPLDLGVTDVYQPDDIQNTCSRLSVKCCPER
ncbi:hypothetical protein SPHINGO391_210025 [Sphingomonas aurantiaca]|uniref:Uncharacterized protein n=1 Tax=Sphingomonas aurantiaca TaxID=185949 RepID=A0A5E7XUQ5_9SPHN|nr:hypothetical protein [Sphingomonas aurantiaca]VVS97976.1 hypothetical protein SPHINGO391_210025 [Sphingomonas aurantiaca]